GSTCIAFFFQAEDGIRDFHVTGVQTCALPIYLKMMYDTFHANIEEKSPASAIRSCADQLVHVHISENDRSTPGEGGVNWDANFAALKEVAYDGWLVIEAFGPALPDLAAATRIWRRMFPSEEHLATEGLNFMKSRWEG